MLVNVGNRTIKLKELLGQGASASVFRNPKDPRRALKVFKDFQSVDPRRLDYQFTHPPAPLSEHGRACFAWPEEPATEPNLGHVIGYTMQAVDQCVILPQVTNPSSRISGVGREFLLDVAISYVSRIYALQWDEYVAFDANPLNIFVSRFSDVTLIDLDSLQFTLPGGEKVFSQYARPELLAPEYLHPGVDLSHLERTKEGDSWTTAIVIHRILRNDEHPFNCYWRPGPTAKKPDLLTRIRSGLWPDSGRQKDCLPPRTISPTWGELPKPLRELFQRTFDTEGFSNPASRPKTLDWLTTLQQLRKRSWGVRLGVAIPTSAWNRQFASAQTSVACQQVPKPIQQGQTPAPPPNNSARKSPMKRILTCASVAALATSLSFNVYLCIASADPAAIQHRATAIPRTAPMKSTSGTPPLWRKLAAFKNNELKQ